LVYRFDFPSPARVPIDYRSTNSDTDFGLCLLQRLSRRLVAVQLREALDPPPRSETLHIVDLSIRTAALP
jgi:hypothetical protein